MFFQNIINIRKEFDTPLKFLSVSINYYWMVRLKCISTQNMDILNKKQLPRSALQKSRWSKSCSGSTLKYWCREVIPGSFVKITTLHGCSTQRSALWFEEHHPLKAPLKKCSVDLLHHLTYSFYQEHMREATSQ